MKSRYVRERLLLPLGIPALAALLIGVLVLASSRILLAVSKDMAVVVATGMSAVILLGAAALTIRPAPRRLSLGVASLAGVGILGVGALAGAIGYHPLAHQEPGHGTGPPPATSPAPSPQPSGPVEVGDNFFGEAPHEVRIKVGETVTWEHVGNIPHTVTSDVVPFDSSPNCPAQIDACLARGDTFEFTFSTAGTFGYYCKLHGFQPTGDPIPPGIQAGYVIVEP